jgi:hypothetical protein
LEHGADLMRRNRVASLRVCDVGFGHGKGTANPIRGRDLPRDGALERGGRGRFGAWNNVLRSSCVHHPLNLCSNVGFAHNPHPLPAPPARQAGVPIPVGEGGNNVFFFAVAGGSGTKEPLAEPLRTAHRPSLQR